MARGLPRAHKRARNEASSRENRKGPEDAATGKASCTTRVSEDGGHRDGSTVRPHVLCHGR
jgi:hypothetical protein